MLHLPSAFALLLSAAVTAAAQCTQPLNQNPDCIVYVSPLPFSTVYYAPSDTGDIEMRGYARGTCDAGSATPISFYSGSDYYAGSLIANCGCLPLDGEVYFVDCPGVDKGTIAEGDYHFNIDLGPNNPRYDPFTITHTQSTATAATPTSTATATTYESTEVTTTTTSTATATSPQVTVTSPAGTVVQTNTVTPTAVTTTITKTQTRTRRVGALTVVQTTFTWTAPCTTPSLSPCLTAQPVGPRNRPRQQDGSNINGDGPLTTTVTPSGVVVTQTVDGGTTTDTATAYATTTTTVPPTPLTSTFYTGTTTNIRITTLRANTTTMTQHTSKTTTMTQTLTLTWPHLAIVTPVCAVRAAY